MKIAIVQSRSYQTFAGGDGTFIDALVRHLKAKGHDLIGLTSAPTKSRPRAWLRHVYASTRTIPWRFHGARRIGDRHLMLSPHVIADFVQFVRARLHRNEATSEFAVAPSPGEQRWLSSRLAKEKPDVAILCFEAAAAARAVRALGIPTVALVGFLPIRSYELSGDAIDSTRVSGAGLEFINAVRAADVISFNSRDDCSYAHDTLGIAHPVFAGIGYEKQSCQTAGRSRNVAFVGNKTGPNRSAVGWFLEAVWPHVRDAVPDARFRIIGRASHYFAAAEADGIECVGAVDDLSAEYCQSRVVVAPLRSGSAGVKTKVVEALSYGCPIVATTLGVDAADIGQLNLAGFIENQGPAFAARIVALLTDDMLWQEKHRGTQAVFDALFSPEAAYGEMDAALEAMCNSSR